MSSSIRDIRTYIDNVDSIDNYDKEITVEHRSNNPKRDYLFVNRMQGKHIPCSPVDTIAMCNTLADEVNNTLQGLYKNILVIGFAETATAIAHFVAKMVDNCHYMMCTTRENMEQCGKQLITFEEEHSHATTQMLYTWKDDRFDFSKVDYVLFVDDEISTGNTIMNFVKAFRKSQSKIPKDVAFGVASICNWQDEETARRFEIIVDRFYLVSGQLKDVNAKMNFTKDKINGTIQFIMHTNDVIVHKLEYDTDYRYSAVLGMKPDQPIIPTDLVDKLMPIRRKKVRVIGTEECMAPSIEVGWLLDLDNISVLCHSTTRSKIDVIDDCETENKSGEVITSRYEVKSFYDINRQNYIYNMEPSDVTIIITSADVDWNEHQDLIDIVSANTNEIYLVRI